MRFPRFHVTDNHSLAPRVILLYGIIIAGFAVAGRVHAQPVIAVRDTFFQFGTVYRDHKVTHTVSVRNVGKSNLHIETVTSPCGCTTTQLEKYDIAPGDSAQLTITLNSSILLGKVQKYIVIVSNDLEHRNAFVHYEADIINVLTSRPPLLYMGVVFTGTEVTDSITLTNTTPAPIHLLDITSRSGKLKLSRIPQLLNPGDSAKLMVSLFLDHEVTFKDEIRVTTDNGIQPVVRIHVVASGKRR